MKINRKQRRKKQDSREQCKRATVRFLDENEDATDGKENRAISELVGAEVHS